MGNNKVLKFRGHDNNKIIELDINVLAKAGKNGTIRLFDVETGRDLMMGSDILARLEDGSVSPIHIGALMEPVDTLVGHKRGDKLTIDKVVDNPTYGWINVHFNCTVMEGRMSNSILGDRDLSDVDKLIIYDYSDYDPRFCNNGGKYGFWVNYKRESNSRWRVSHGTTADFEYCPCCGQFGNHYDPEDDDYTCGGFSYMSDDEIQNLLNNLSTEDEFDIIFKKQEAATA